ncbi:MAG: hypothetical protein GWN99_09695 [Gemmatimonadetes bacterium]|uniref:Methyltransferase domain-containing protein n=1 Tax=Candidatus Kutchimonas denitrificans TaxID=3056748 RepID=A0AAE4ZB22_9BACT|nr:hypothetical protein [Gemmatimonadota bacterium]NIR74140.1 hypothetical protein [Candidatus Kutchimonas denitrificans]NIS01322.1 hypothetical protein [Gemmatimonadota bacterium]NIT67053.1 hypothetical protein [Gemmatimonadota bacterium]NIU51713.1 hypothetical protein [Gemmatimonadota bacterium]
MSTLDYRDFLADAPRVEAFRRAIESTVEAGDVVLDLGTGLGTYGMFAARAGARVVAVEPAPIVEVARSLARDNGLSDRMTFLRGRVEELEPPELADVLIFEDYAPYLYHGETSRILSAVRDRWLQPAPRGVPYRVRALLAPVSCAESYRAIWPFVNEDLFGLDIGRFRRQLLNGLHAVSWDPDVLLAEATEVDRFDPLRPERLKLEASVSWTAARPGILHGLGLWIDLDLADGIEFSNGPSGRSTGWDQRLLPLLEPVTVEAGDIIEARVRTLGPGSGEPDWWSWRVRAGADDPQELDTFRGVPLSLDTLGRARLDRRPRLGGAGRVRRAVLELIDGERTTAEIVRELRERFPREVSSDRQALRAVARELEGDDAETGNPMGAEERLAEARGRTR